MERGMADPIDDIADDINASAGIIRLEAEGQKWSLEAVFFLAAADNVMNQVISPLVAASAGPVSPARVYGGSIGSFQA